MCDNNFVSHVLISCQDYHQMHDKLQEWTRDLVGEITMEFGENLKIQSDTQCHELEFKK